MESALAVTVYTEAVCDVCTEKLRVDGIGGINPPVGWTESTLAERVAGPGWSGGGRRWRYVLCPDCTDALLGFLDSRRGRVVGEGVLDERPARER